MDSVLENDSSDKCDFYELLGCDENSTMEQIITEYKLKARHSHPDKNLTSNHSSTEDFKKLQEAKIVLTDPEKRKDYDTWRQSGMVISYKKWCSLNESVRTTMHWASRPKAPKNMLEGPESREGSLSPVPEKKRKGYKSDMEGYVVGNIVWQRQKGNDLLRKFRNYEI